MEYFVANGLISIPPSPPSHYGNSNFGQKTYFRTVSNSEYRNVLSCQPAVADGCSRCGGEENPHPVTRARRGVMRRRVDRMTDVGYVRRETESLEVRVV